MSSVVDLMVGIVNTIAGKGASGCSDGVGTKATFNMPMRIAIDDEENLYISDCGNHRIRKISKQGIIEIVNTGEILNLIYRNRSHSGRGFGRV